jgi:hypothetical protein
VNCAPILRLGINVLQIHPSVYGIGQKNQGSWRFCANLAGMTARFVPKPMPAREFLAKQQAQKRPASLRNRIVRL